MVDKSNRIRSMIIFCNLKKLNENLIFKHKINNLFGNGYGRDERSESRRKIFAFLRKNSWKIVEFYKNEKAEKSKVEAENFYSF